MALTTAYLVATKKLDQFLADLRAAKAPERFTIRFLEDLGYKSTNDRLFVGMLKALGLLDDNGVPTQRYFDFLDDEHWPQVLAEGIEEAYEDLYRLKREAHSLTKTQLIGKLKSLTEGKKSDSVLDNMARTFKELAKLADFTRPQAEVAAPPAQEEGPAPDAPSEAGGGFAVPPEPLLPGRPIDGLTYRIELVLPSARDKAVYDAIFRSLKEHLL
jgi:uncharacterized protein DUF5343